MTKPMLLADFVRVPRALRGSVHAGLPSAIDAVATQAQATHRFLRFGWFAAAVAAYGGQPRTALVDGPDGVAAALPFVPVGPRWLGLGSVPGCYWPFRSFPAAATADAPVFATLAQTLAGALHGVRIGPVYDDDPAAMPLIDAMRADGWAVMPRRVAESYRLDMAGLQAEGTWPRNSTLRKNRFHEKHLAGHGKLDWRFVTGDDWPQAFDALSDIEQRSWIAERTDGSDAKFTAVGHGAFWRAAAADPVLAGMMRAALLTIDGTPAAFSFDLDAGPLKYAIANSYDPAVGKHSPGKLLYYRNLVDALDRGIKVVDWGAGDSGYKATIGAAEGPMIRDWLLLRPGLPAAIGRLLRGRWEASGH